MPIINETVQTMQAKLDEGAQSEENIAAAMAAHVAATDPHPTYQKAKSMIPTNHFYIVTATTSAVENAQYMPISKSAGSVKILNDDPVNAAAIGVGDSPIEACDSLLGPINYSSIFLIPPKKEIEITDLKKWFAYAGISAPVSLQITQYR